MYDVSITIQDLDAESAVDAVEMFLEALATCEPLYFDVELPDGSTVQVSTDKLKKETVAAANQGDHQDDDT